VTIYNSDEEKEEKKEVKKEVKKEIQLDEVPIENP